MSPLGSDPDPKEAVRRELEAHVAERVEELAAQGVARAEAESQARRELGDTSAAEREMESLARRVTPLG